MSDCLFCKIASGEIPSERVLESDEWVAFRDINPLAPVHILIIPRKHIATSDDIVDGDKALVGEMVLAGAKIARDQGLAELGYRLVMNCREHGGQEVFHLHLHLLGGRKMGALG